MVTIAPMTTFNDSNDYNNNPNVDASSYIEILYQLCILYWVRTYRKCNKLEIISSHDLF